MAALRCNILDIRFGFFYDLARLCRIETPGRSAYPRKFARHADGLRLDEAVGIVYSEDLRPPIVMQNRETNRCGYSDAMQQHAKGHVPVIRPIGRMIGITTPLNMRGKDTSCYWLVFLCVYFQRDYSLRGS